MPTAAARSTTAAAAQVAAATAAFAAATAAEPEVSPVPELARLQRAYWAKVEAELKPVVQRYVEALHELEKSLIAKGELAAAGEVRAERETIASAAVYAPGYTPSDREKPVDSAERLAEFLAGTRWEMERGGATKEVSFQPGGKADVGGEPVTWEAVNERLVVVSAPAWVGELSFTFNLKLDAFVGRSNIETVVWKGRVLGE